MKENMEEKIVDIAIEKKFTRPKQIKSELQVSVSSRTIRRRLNEVGLFGGVARKEYPYTDAQLQKRLEFANKYKHWTGTEWDLVLFSDEAHIELGPHGRVWVQRPYGASFEPEYMTTKTPHPERVSIWGCFSGRGLGEMEIFTDILDADLLKRILRNCLLPSARRLFPPGQWYFLQDNDPKHRSIKIKTHLHNAGVDCIELPPYSPDLNPIENLWKDLKRRVEQRNPRNVEELTQIVSEEWSATDSSFLAKLSHSMPSRLIRVIANHGHKINY